MTAAGDPRSGLQHAFILDGEGGGESIDWQGVERWRPEQGVLWLNLDYAAADVQSWLGLGAGLDPVVREALLDRDPRPRALSIGDSLLLIVRGINVVHGSEPEDMVSVRCWIEPHRIITLRHRMVRAVKHIATQLRAGAGPRSSGQFVTEMVEQILEPVVTMVDNVDDEIAAIEDDVLVGHASEQRARLADLRRRAIAVRRFIAPQRDAFTRLAAQSVPWLDAGQQAQLREAADRQTRTVEELDAARDRAAVTHEEMQSRMDELANRRLYMLSLVTAVFLPLSFVTGLLGVNVGGVPARDVEWAFWVLCAVMVMLSLAQFWLFRRWKWM